MDRVILQEVGKSFPINHKLAGVVPMASDTEQALLTEDIKKNGLREPITLYRGEIVDGRCRQIACLLSGTRIMAKELDDDLTEDEVRIFVKSVNTRRNLTSTQKIMSACRESLRPGSGTVKDVAKAWGVSKTILDNARYIVRVRPEFLDPLFNGQGVTIIDSNGKKTVSTKVSAIYAYLRREEQAVKEDTQHGWDENAYIKTQAGKEWYYKQVKMADSIGSVKYKMLVAELANYKFANATSATNTK